MEENLAHSSKASSRLLHHGSFRIPHRPLGVILNTILCLLNHVPNSDRGTGRDSARFPHRETTGDSDNRVAMSVRDIMIFSTC